MGWIGMGGDYKGREGRGRGRRMGRGKGNHKHLIQTNTSYKDKDIRRLILLLKLMKHLMALVLDGRLFHQCAPL